MNGVTKYILTRGTHGRFEEGAFVQYKSGDSIWLTEKEAEALKGRVELAVNANESVSGVDASDAPGSDAEWSFLDDLHHVKAVEFVRGLDDPEQVQSALDYELAHKNRPSVTFAAKDRLKEIAAADVDSGNGNGEEDSE